MSYDPFSAIDEGRKEKKEKKPKRVSKGKKKPKKGKRAFSKEKGVSISSDEIRTSFFLITKNSSRERVPKIFIELRDFFNNHKIEEVSYNKYQIYPKK